MRTLRLGSKGPDVEKWQAFLRGWKKNSLIVIDGNFDRITDLETKQYQVDRRLGADGIVGNATYAAAMRDGFGLVEDDSKDITSPNWPEIPAGAKPVGAADRENLFGRFAYIPAPTQNNPEAIRLTDDWAKKNITSVTIPQLSGVSGAPKSGNVQVHTALASQFSKMFQAWENHSLLSRLITWDGLWVPRFSRGSRSYLSNHSWGSAFDINVRWNGLGVRPALTDEKGSVRELVEIAYEYGFYWGGWFTKRPDGMHFEAYKIL